MLCGHADRRFALAARPPRLRHAPAAAARGQGHAGRSRVAARARCGLAVCRAQARRRGSQGGARSFARTAGSSRRAQQTGVGVSRCGRPATARSSINAAVDVCNIVSLHSGLPISVVDLAKATPPFRVAVAAAGSSYVFNASGQTIDLGGLLCLCDADGPCANAVKDAQRTKTEREHDANADRDLGHERAAQPRGPGRGVVPGFTCGPRRRDRGGHRGDRARLRRAVSRRAALG